MNAPKFQTWQGATLVDVAVDPSAGARLVLPDGSWIELSWRKSSGEVSLASSCGLVIHAVSGNTVRISTTH